MRDFCFLIKKEHPLIEGDKDRLELAIPSEMMEKIGQRLLKKSADKKKLKKYGCFYFSGTLMSTDGKVRTVMPKKEET